MVAWGSKKLCSGFLTALLQLASLFAIAGCGGGGDASGRSSTATVSTLAYVVSECGRNAKDNSGTLRQALQIRQGDESPITVVEHTATIGIDGLVKCYEIGRRREGFLFVQYGVFHRLGVTPDGSQVVFEVTDDSELTLFPAHALPADQKGIFVVNADGRNPHRLAAASREQPGDAAFVDFRPFFVFSPNGRMIAYTDRGPGPDNEDAVQIFTLDLVTGIAGPVTQLPPAGPGGTYGPLFIDDQTIAFLTFADVHGDNPDGQDLSVRVDTIDGKLTIDQPPVEAIPGSQVLTTFRITGAEVNVADLVLPGEKPVNGYGDLPVQEIFVIDGSNNVLQLTNFGRAETVNPTLTADGQRIIFAASADHPSLHTNPREDCQIFSIDRTGGDLRQLTHFHEGEGPRSMSGCFIQEPPRGCGVVYMSRDTRSDALVFYSACDPFDANPYGAQLFAMRTDGTGLTQLTTTQGLSRDLSGGFRVEQVFPFAYPGLSIVYNYFPNRPIR